MTQKLAPGVAKGIARSKVLPVYMGITLLLFIFIGFGQSASANPLLAHSEKAAMREIREIAENAASLLNVYMDARVTDMLVCSRLGGPIRDALSKSDGRMDANQILEEWLKTSGAYDAILLLDRKGVCLASAPASLVNQDLSNNEAFKGAVTGRLTITDAHKSEILTALDPKSIAWTVVIAVPVLTEDEIAGVLISCVNWSKVGELIKRIRIGTPFGQTYPSGRLEFSSGYVYVFNQKDEIILGLFEDEYGVSLRNPRTHLPGFEDAIRNKAANQRYEIRHPITGRKSMVLVGLAYPKKYGNFPGLGWVVGASVSEDELIGAPWWMQLFR